MLKIKVIFIFCFLINLLYGCVYNPSVQSISEDAWIIDLGVTNPNYIAAGYNLVSLTKIYQYEAAKEARNRGCKYFKRDATVKTGKKRKRVFRCAENQDENVLVTEEIITLNESG